VLGPANERILDHVLGVADGAEDAVGDAEQPRPQGRDVGHVATETRMRASTCSAISGGV
jgi:hypothetical protein